MDTIHKYSQVLLVLSFLLNCHPSDASVYISSKYQTWTSAVQDHTCKMLGLTSPEDKGSNHVNFVSDTITLQSSVKKGSEAWVGAHIEYTQWQTFKGCHFIDHRHEEGFLLQNNSDAILQCSQICKGEQFFLSSSKCYCSIREKLGVCQTAVPCQQGPNTDSSKGICGYSDRCVCQYSPENTSGTDDQIQNHVGNCLTISVLNNKLNIEPSVCSRQRHFVCFYKKYGIVFKTRTKHDWKDAGIFCTKFQSQSLQPHLLKKTDIVKQLENHQLDTVWLGQIRRPVIKWGLSDKTVHHCLTAVFTKLGPKFNIRRCSIKLPSWCITSDDHPHSLSKQLTKSLPISTEWIKQSHIYQHYKSSVSEIGGHVSTTTTSVRLSVMPHGSDLSLSKSDVTQDKYGESTSLISSTTESSHHNTITPDITTEDHNDTPTISSTTDSTHHKTTSPDFTTKFPKIEPIIPRTFLIPIIICSIFVLVVILIVIVLRINHYRKSRGKYSVSNAEREILRNL